MPHRIFVLGRHGKWLCGLALMVHMLCQWGQPSLLLNVLKFHFIQYLYNFHCCLCTCWIFHHRIKWVQGNIQRREWQMVLGDAQGSTPLGWYTLLCLHSKIHCFGQQLFSLGPFHIWDCRTRDQPGTRYFLKHTQPSWDQVRGLWV